MFLWEFLLHRWNSFRAFWPHQFYVHRRWKKWSFQSKEHHPHCEPRRRLGYIMGSLCCVRHRVPSVSTGEKEKKIKSEDYQGVLRWEKAPCPVSGSSVSAAGQGSSGRITAPSAAASPDLNQSEHLWGELKPADGSENPSIPREPGRFAREELRRVAVSLTATKGAWLKWLPQKGCATNDKVKGHFNSFV